MLYLEDSATPAKRAAKAKTEASFRLQSYYGYSFESFCTADPPPPSALADPPAPPAFTIPNTNVQWCSVVKTSIGGVRLLIGGEVDCITPSPGPITTADFIELKTNIAISSARDEAAFERNKLLKHYVQSFLLGVPRVIVGFRTREGILTGLQTFPTLEIPRLVRGKPHAWDPLACLASARQLLGFLLTELGRHSSTVAWHDAADAEEQGEAPVFRLSFSAGGNTPPAVGLRQLSGAEVEEEVLGDKQAPVGGGRVGFLLESWVKQRLAVRTARRERQDPDPGPEPSAPLPPHPPRSGPGPTPSFALQR